jgi:hypothetical protein
MKSKMWTLIGFGEYGLPKTAVGDPRIPLAEQICVIEKSAYDELRNAYREVVLAMQPLVRHGILNMGEDAKLYVELLNQKLSVLESLGLEKK